MKIHLAFVLAILLACASTSLIKQLKNKPLSQQRENPTQVNENFVYNISQTVNKNLIGLDYAAEIYTGYIPVDDKGSRIFYHLYPANGAKDPKANLNNSYPLILWMQGGPGCSDWLAALTELGPYIIVNDTKGNQVPQLTAINWNQGYNLLFVDQPPGVGFSPIGDGVNLNNSVQAAQYMQTFLVSFFKIYTSLVKNSFYIFGESYAGHYIPALAALIYSNRTNNGLKLNGIAIGDGLVNPYYHAMGWWQAAYATGVVDTHTSDQMKAWGLEAQKAFNALNYSGVAALFDEIIGAIANYPQTGVYDPDDYRDVQQPGIPPYEIWIESPNMRAAYGADPDIEYSDCDGTIYTNFYADIGASFAANISYLLNNNIPVLIYNGQDDLVIPIAGTRGWLNALTWSKSANWLAASTKSYYDSNKNVIGTIKSYGGLTFIVVNKAGHMVPAYVPANAKQMIDNFIQGKFTSTAEEVIDV